MAIAEIDEETLMRYRGLEGAVNKILAHPEAAKLVEKAHKLVEPSARTPRTDAMAPIETELEALRKERSEWKSERELEKQQRETDNKISAMQARIDSGFAELRRDGWTQEGLDGVRKLMDDEGIMNPRIAADHFEKLHPPSAPATPSGSGAWNFMEAPADNDANYNALLQSQGKNDQVLNKMAHDALNEVRGQSRR